MIWAFSSLFPPSQPSNEGQPETFHIHVQHADHLPSIEIITRAQIECVRGGTHQTPDAKACQVLQPEYNLAAFDAKLEWPDATPSRYLPQLEAAGLIIAQVEDWSGKLAFTDVGAIVY